MLCGDCPKLHTDGPKRDRCCSDEAARAKDEALQRALSGGIERGAPVPAPSRAERRRQSALARKGSA